jgi:hypothetical protein
MNFNPARLEWGAANSPASNIELPVVGGGTDRAGGKNYQNNAVTQ